jgi:hypothetical protein
MSEFGKFDQFIGVWDGAMPDEICQSIIKFYHDCTQYNLTYRSNALYKTDNDIVMPLLHVGDYVGYDAVGPHLSSFWMFLNNCLKDYIAKYPALENAKLSSDSWKIHKVEPGQGYHGFHSEWTPDNSDRVLAWMVYLEEPEAGGETEFLYQHTRVDPKAGRIAIWPAGFTHLHRGNSPLKGNKMYATGWFKQA